jgi:hypothetical protein
MVIGFISDEGKRRELQSDVIHPQALSYEVVFSTHHHR